MNDETVGQRSTVQLVVAATFTADPMRQPLQFWVERLEIAGEIILAPYAQVLQELLSPDSLLASNKTGCNVLLIRLEDWFRDRATYAVERNVEHVRAVANEFLAALDVLRSRTSATLLIFLAPLSVTLLEAYREALQEIQNGLAARLAALDGVQCWTHTDLVRLYPVPEHEDALADRIGHIPYTNEYFTAIATLIARRIGVLFKPRCKVIALDCDNTLWSGICGEDGAAGVRLTPAHLEFQRTLIHQYEAGVLLCLCSKNNESDVAAVLNRPDMLLREEHVVSSRINWQPKSENLRSLAAELDLGLDSFLLIDDSAVECAEVRARCPQVVALQFPATAEGITDFLDHVWAFDRVATTTEARHRTAQYRQNRARAQAQAQAADFQQFLASLKLQIEVKSMQPAQLARVAELVQRTNQFNLSAIRRRASQIEELCSSGAMSILVVEVRDRFGDYGLAGAVLFRRAEQTVEVDTLVLSCRVLGRGVEQRLIAELGRIAGEEGRRSVTLSYRRTARNAPAWQFLQTCCADFCVSRDGADSQGCAAAQFDIPARSAAQFGHTALVAQPGDDREPAAANDAELNAAAGDWYEAAYQLRRVDDVIKEINRRSQRVRHADFEYHPPSTPLEAAVAGIWSELLGLEEVSVRADFMELGGDSLLAVRVIARIGSVLGLELSIYDFFERPTIEQCAAQLGRASRAGAAIQATPLRDSAPLSRAQQRLWFIDQLEAGSAAYHIPVSLRLYGRLDEAALRVALNAVVQRHPTLRTTFVATHAGAVQHIAADVNFALCSVDLAGASRPATEAAEQSREELLAPFDLRAGPLIRGRLLRLSPGEHVLLMTMHHMVADGWSVGILVREIAELYEAVCERRNATLPALSVQYVDYVQWQQKWLATDTLDAQLAYWMEHLRGAPELLELPTDRQRPAVQSYRGATVPIQLESDVVVELRSLARRSNLTLAMTLYAAWSVLLARLSGQDNIVIGIPVANRRRTELEGLVGFFVNTLAVRIRLDDDPSVTDLMARVKRILIGAYTHQDAPLEMVVEALQPVRSLSHSPIFQAMFVLHDTPQSLIELPGLRLVQEDVALHTSQFDVTLALHESAAGISGMVNYATDLFDADTIHRWLSSFQVLLRAMARQPQSTVSSLPLLSEYEQRQLLELFNATGAPYASEQLLHQLFERQAACTPNALAVLCEGQFLTYGELNAKANQLARRLLECAVGPDQLVGICAERSLEMVVGLLGILKAGGAYVPLDPDYPPQRLAYMLADAAPGVVLTQRHLRERLPQTDARIIMLDTHCRDVARFDVENPDPRALGLRSTHLAYVIYTSGSTGQPKGAMNEHRALINRLQWMQDAYCLDVSDRVLQKTPFSFDVSVWEFFWTLLNGACLVMARPRGHQDPAYVTQVIEDTRVTTLHFVPSMLQAFLDQHQVGRCPSLRHVVCSGEELPASLRQTFFRLLPGVQLSNLYGPTEAAVDVTFWECREDEQGRVPIGRPIANTQIYVLDRHGQPAPIGVAGEIHIGGVGVGRGYFNRPELTTQRFVPDPFDCTEQARLYRTGDLGRWRPDGAIEYLGRNDYQVKLRGFRIELGEIEAQLTRHPQVKEAAVVAREDIPGEKRLTAYVVAADPALPPDNDALRAHLSASLPEFMVPGGFVQLDRMPLSPNGKLDRRALPAPQADAYTQRAYAAPQTELEALVASIWRDLLHLERVGRHDNFFELGGHSLLIVQMIERLRRVGLSTPLRRVFENPVLSELAGALACESAVPFEVPPNAVPSQCVALTPQMLPLVQLEPQHIEHITSAVPGGAANVQDIYPLAPLQEGILFHHLLNDHGGDTYVLSTVLSVASRQRLDELIVAVQDVIDRHDVLRTAVLWEQLPQPIQVVCRQAHLPLIEATLDSGLRLQEQLEAWVAPERQRMDLRQAPLVRLHVATGANGSLYALLQLHHIVADGQSLRTVVAEIVAHLEGRATQLPKPIPYRNHVAQILGQARIDKAEAYFTDRLGDVAELTAPFALADIHGGPGRIAEASKTLDSELTKRVGIVARQCGVSAATLFHAAWGLVVARTSGRDDVVFGSVLLGRLQSGASGQQAVGMFMNTLPLRLRLRGASALELVARAQRELIGLLQHEQVPLALAQRCSGVGGTTPLFSSLLNYRHSPRTLAAEWSEGNGIQALENRAFTNYPLTMSVDEMEGAFALSAQTDRRVDPGRVVSMMETAVCSLVDALEHCPQAAALALSILPADERRRVVESLNDTDRPYSLDILVHELFEQQVRRTPDAIAVTHDERALTYADLNARANQLARCLRARGVAPDQSVGICVERGIEMVVGVLGILKSGAAYLPLDPHYPAERLAYMLRDAAPAVVLTEERTQMLLPSTPARSIILDARGHGLDSYSVEDLPKAELGASAANLVYVIYTSGSTGQPKGTEMCHYAMVNLMEWHRETFAARVAARVLQFAALSFDVAFQETFSTLCTGGTLVMLDEWVRRDARALLALLCRQAVTRLFVPPLMLQSLAGAFRATRTIPRSLTDIVSAGEQLKVTDDIRDFCKHLNGCRLHNHYGPTETHVVTALQLSGDPAQWPHLPSIGRPIANTQILILDERREPVPLGVVGEIHIAGASLARGYHDRPQLSAERFVANPFAAHARGRMYRTGDLGRWHVDGTIEYLGRNDDQVKIRGFRVELQEIQRQLALHADVEEAAVVAREDAPGEKRLVAYVTRRAGCNPTSEELRAHLARSLPEYMVPRAFVVLQRLPLTPTGKLNARALPPPDLEAYVSRDYQPPSGEMEETVARVWRDVLQLERIGRRDNFFDLGGHSLLAMQAAARIHAAVGVELPVRLLFETNTLEELAGRLDDLRRAHLFDVIAAGGEEMQELLQEVAAMPEHAARELLDRIAMEGRP